MKYFMSSQLLIIVAIYVLSTNAVYYSKGDQGLTSFPHDIPEDVTHIWLGNNNISKVDFIEPFPDLIDLSLSNNGLEEFPNCLNITGLWELYLENNKITFIPTQLIIFLSNLNYIALLGNPLTSLPNFGVLPLFVMLEVDLQDDYFVCDWRMALAKQAAVVGKVEFATYPPRCSSPVGLVFGNWLDISISDMLQEGKIT